MYVKLKKYYPCDSRSSITIEELEQVAEEIRSLIVGPAGIAMPEYIKRASSIPMVKLGHRRIYSIKKEPKLEAYFPLAVWNILKERCDKVKSSRLTEDDNQFIMKNRGRGFKWISERLYVTSKDLSRKAKQIGVEIVHSSINNYTPSIMQFVKENAYRGAPWIGNKLAIDADAIRSKCKRDGIVLKSRKKCYTLSDDEFIRRNFNKGSLWLSQQLHVTRKAIMHRAERLNVEIINNVAKNEEKKFK